MTKAEQERATQDLMKVTLINAAVQLVTDGAAASAADSASHVGAVTEAAASFLEGEFRRWTEKAEAPDEAG